MYMQLGMEGNVQSRFPKQPDMYTGLVAKAGRIRKVLKGCLSNCERCLGVFSVFSVSACDIHLVKCLYVSVTLACCSARQLNLSAS